LSLTSHRIIYADNTYEYEYAANINIDVYLLCSYHVVNCCARRRYQYDYNFPGFKQWECGRKWWYGRALAIGFAADESRTGE
jgi:hypothetical protein